MALSTAIIMKLHLKNSILLSIICLLSLTVHSQDRKTSIKYFNIGQEKFAAERYEEAILYFSKAIEADSSNFSAWIKRGFIKGVMNDFTGELNDYTTVIEKDPKHIWAYISRGSAKNRRREYESAIADFNKALEINPREPEAYNNRGFAKKGLGDKEGACKDWVKSRKMGNDEARIILVNNECK